MEDYQLIYTYTDNFKDFNSVQPVEIKKAFFNNPPKYSVCIPTFKRVSTLNTTLESAINQDCGFEYEIIVVDNNPERNDETEELIKNKYSSCKYLSYYKNSQNIGMTGNWNRLFELSRSKWVIMLHDDDCLYPETISNIDGILNKEEDANVLFLETSNELERETNNDKIKYFRLSTIDFMLANAGGVAGTVMNRERSIALGGFNNNYYPSADLHFWFLNCLHGKVIKQSGRALAFYRLGINTSMKTSSKIGFVNQSIKLRQGVLYNRNRFARFIWNKARRYATYIISNSYLTTITNEEELDMFKKQAGIKTKPLDQIFYKVLQRYSIFQMGIKEKFLSSTVQ